jgi:hypothetical protein
MPFLSESKPVFDELPNGFDGGPPNVEAPELVEDPKGFASLCGGPDLVDAPKGFVGAEADAFPKGLEGDFPNELPTEEGGAFVEEPNVELPP